MKFFKDNPINKFKYYCEHQTIVFCLKPKKGIEYNDCKTLWANQTNDSYKIIELKYKDKSVYVLIEGQKICDMCIF